MTALQVLKAAIPLPVKQQLKRWLLRSGHPVASQVKGVGRILDLYAWVVDDAVDTLVPLHNFYSFCFPAIDTATEARLEIYAADGGLLGNVEVPVSAFAAPTVRVSDLLSRIGAARQTLGNLIWDLRTPAAVSVKVGAMGKPFLFWDRSYIGYVGREDQISYVHGIDKSEVVSETGVRTPWRIDRGDSFTARPEIPVLVTEAVRTEIIVQNRATWVRQFTMIVQDAAGKSRDWSAQVAPRGVHRFVLDGVETAGLDVGAPLRLELTGLPTRYGRPVLFRRFASGAISAMHC